MRKASRFAAFLAAIILTVTALPVTSSTVLAAEVGLEDGFYEAVREDVGMGISISDKTMTVGDTMGTYTLTGDKGVYHSERDSGGTPINGEMAFRVAGDSIFIEMELWSTEDNDTVMQEVEYVWMDEMQQYVSNPSLYPAGFDPTVKINSFTSNKTDFALNEKISLTVKTNAGTSKLKFEYRYNGKWHFDDLYVTSPTSSTQTEKTWTAEFALTFEGIDAVRVIASKSDTFSYDSAIITPIRVQKAEPIKVFFDSKEVQFDQPPINDGGRILVPIRAISESMGANVDWKADTQTATITTDSTTIIITINNKEMLVDGSGKPLDVPAKIVGGRTLIPVRAVSEAFGADVEWKADEKAVYIEGSK